MLMDIIKDLQNGWLALVILLVIEAAKAISSHRKAQASIKHEEAEAKVDEARRQEVTERSIRDAMAKAMDEYRDKIAEMGQEISKLKSDIAMRTVSESELRCQLQNLRNMVDQQAKALESQEKTIRYQATELEDARNAIEAQRQQIFILEGKVSALETEKAAERAEKERWKEAAIAAGVTGIDC